MEPEWLEQVAPCSPFLSLSLSLCVCVCVCFGCQELYIYDSAGKEVFADHIPEYVSTKQTHKHTHRATHTHQWENPGVVLVAYDVTMEQSLDSCIKWLERVRAQKPAVETQLPGQTSLLGER